MTDDAPPPDGASHDEDAVTAPRTADARASSLEDIAHVLSARTPDIAGDPCPEPEDEDASAADSDEGPGVELLCLLDELLVGGHRGGVVAAVARLVGRVADYDVELHAEDLSRGRQGK